MGHSTRDPGGWWGGASGEGVVGTKGGEAQLGPRKMGRNGQGLSILSSVQKVPGGKSLGGLYQKTLSCIRLLDYLYRRMNDWIVSKSGLRVNWDRKLLNWFESKDV